MRVRLLRHLGGPVLVRRLPFRFPSGNSFPRAFGALFRCHRFEGSLTADLAAFGALLSKVVQNLSG